MSNTTAPTNGTCNLSLDSSQCTLETCCLAIQGQIPYIPNLAANILYAALFGAILVGQLFFGLKSKTWSFLVWMALGLAGEVVGYIGRLMLHNNPFDFNAFLIYLIPLTIAPAFMTASIYLCLARIIVIFDPRQRSSRLKPMTYTKIFVTFDLISLILQAAGGAIAAIADDKKTSDLGVNVMIAGLAFQVVSLLIFMALCTDFWWRHRKNKYSTLSVNDTVTAAAKIRRTKMFRGFIWALIAATFLILVRSVYRLAELQGGFNGKIAADETLFMILEGPCIILACLGLTIFHPGLAVGEAWSSLLKANAAGDVNQEMLLGKGGASMGYNSAYGSDQDLQTRENNA